MGCHLCFFKGAKPGEGKKCPEGRGLESNTMKDYYPGVGVEKIGLCNCLTLSCVHSLSCTSSGNIQLVKLTVSFVRALSWVLTTKQIRSLQKASINDEKCFDSKRLSHHLTQMIPGSCKAWTERTHLTSFIGWENVLAVNPTRFGKIFICQSLILAKEMLVIG